MIHRYIFWKLVFCQHYSFYLLQIPTFIAFLNTKDEFGRGSFHSIKQLPRESLDLCLPCVEISQVSGKLKLTANNLTQHNSKKLWHFF